MTVDAFSSESNRRTRRFWSRYGEPGSEAVDAMSVRDWGKSKCPRCRRWHREVVYAFPPTGLIRHVVRKAMVDRAVCVLVVPVATTASHWSKLVHCSLLGDREAPDGYLRIRAPGAQLRCAASFDPKELAAFVCDFARIDGGRGPDGRLAPACAGAFQQRARQLCGSEDDTNDRLRLREQLLAVRSSSMTGSAWRS